LSQMFGSPKPPNKRAVVRAIWLLLLSFLLGTVSCEQNPASSRFAEATGARLGANVEAFGLQVHQPTGAAEFAPNRIVKWEMINGVARVTVVAEVWSTKQRGDFIASGQSLTMMADVYAKRWGAQDAMRVNADVAGGTEFVYYRSLTLSRAFAQRAAIQGALFVAIPLDPSVNGQLKVRGFGQLKVRTSELISLGDHLLVSGLRASGTTRPG
jgi:hypothetical protein